MVKNNKWVHFRPLYANTAINLLNELEKITLRKILCDRAKKLHLEKRFSQNEMNSWNANEACVKDLLTKLNPETYVMFELSQNYNEKYRQRIDMCLLGLNKSHNNCGSIYLLELKAWDETSYDSLMKERGNPYDQIKSYHELMSGFVANLTGSFDLYGGVCLFNFNGADAAMKTKLYGDCFENFVSFRKSPTHLIINDQSYAKWISFLTEELFVDGCGQAVYDSLFHPFRCPNVDFYQDTIKMLQTQVRELSRDLNERDWVIKKLSEIITEKGKKSRTKKRKASDALNGDEALVKIDSKRNLKKTKNIKEKDEADENAVQQQNQHSDTRPVMA